MKRVTLDVRSRHRIGDMSFSEATGYPYVMQRVSDYRLASANSALEERVAGWPYPRAEDALKAAEAYNRHLASSGQPILGEATDPFATVAGASGPVAVKQIPKSRKIRNIKAC